MLYFVNGKLYGTALAFGIGIGLALYSSATSFAGNDFVFAMSEGVQCLVGCELWVVWLYTTKVETKNKVLNFRSKPYFLIAFQFYFSANLVSCSKTSLGRFAFLLISVPSLPMIT